MIFGNKKVSNNEQTIATTIDVIKITKYLLEIILKSICFLLIIVLISLIDKDIEKETKTDNIKTYKILFGNKYINDINNPLNL